MKGITKIIGGLAIGTVNSALGAGGGMIAVPMLRKAEWSKTERRQTRWHSLCC